MYDTNEDFDFGADLSNVNEQEFDCIPAGKYPIQCVSIELADTKSGGKMVKSTFEVIGGEFSGRKVFENYNVQNVSEKTVNIALGQIKKWLGACGLEPNQRLTLNLLRQLEGREFLAVISIEKDKAGVYSDSNRIKKYEPMPGMSYQAQAPRNEQPFTPPSASTMPPPVAPQAAAAGNTMHWQA